SLMVNLAKPDYVTDPDVGTSYQLTMVTPPQHGSWTLTPAGQFTYTPRPNYLGTDSFTYVVGDGILSSTSATVSMSIQFVDPFDRNDSATLGSLWGGTSRNTSGFTIVSDGAVPTST